MGAGKRIELYVTRERQIAPSPPLLVCEPGVEARLFDSPNVQKNSKTERPKPRKDKRKPSPGRFGSNFIDELNRYAKIPSEIEAKWEILAKKRSIASHVHPMADSGGVSCAAPL